MAATPAIFAGVSGTHSSFPNQSDSCIGIFGATVGSKSIFIFRIAERGMVIIQLEKADTEKYFPLFFNYVFPNTRDAKQFDWKK